MENLNELLEEATSKISSDYFTLPIDGGAPVYRERVYCYELYHQLRCIWPSNTFYVLNGEVDKGGHPLLKNTGAANTIPDFLIHTPGNNDLNHTIIEVKIGDTGFRKCKADLEKIEKFYEQGVRYDRGILLIVGTNVSQNLLNRLYSSVDRSPKTEIWWHSNAGRKATRWSLEQPNVQ